jgi:DNA-binding transcriptional ArsR family regulator
VAIRINTDAATVARSRFATSRAVEVVATLASRAGSGPPHSRRWYARGVARLDDRTVHLLHELVPLDHPYVLDFLTPHPAGTRETRDGMVDAIATTAEEEIEAQLDFAFDGRPVRPEFAASFPDEAAYRRWRRPPPPLVRGLIAAGPRVLAQEAAGVLARFFDAAMADDWARTAAVLNADIAHRAEIMSSQGFAGMLAGLGSELSWDTRALVLPRAYDATVDWATDGVLFVPCTSHRGRVLCAAERPRTPVLIYAARGIAVLRSKPSHSDSSQGLAELIGPTRLRLLELLDEPRTTLDLAQLDGHAAATVSYHLTVLHRAGLVTRQRQGRRVVYRLTGLGDALLGREQLGLPAV